MDESEEEALEVLQTAPPTRPTRPTPPPTYTPVETDPPVDVDSCIVEKWSDWTNCTLQVASTFLMLALAEYHQHSVWWLWTDVD